MAHVIIKYKKYLEGHNYSTGIGYSYSWTSNIKKARKMNKNTAVSINSHCHGKVISTSKIK